MRKTFNSTTALGCDTDCEEIQTALYGHPRVQDVVMFVREDHLGEKRLAVYYVGTDPPEALRIYLREKLRGRKVPAVIIQLEALPLKPNGCVDRQALPV